MSTAPSKQDAISELLAQLRDTSPAIYHEVELTVPAIRVHGEELTYAWLMACRRLSDYDREAGKAFARGSREAEKVSETVLPWTEQALQFPRWKNAWRALEGFMANLPRAYGSLGHAGQRRWAEIGFLWCGRQVESGNAYFATPVVELSGRHGITGIEQLTQPAEELFESRKLLLATYLAGAVRVRNLLGSQAILPWATRGADIMQSGRARGEAYFRLESEESLAVLLDHLPGFRMGERNRLLALLLEIWYEHAFELKESNWSPEKGRPFVESDGRSVFIPAVMPDRDEAILAVLHTAGRQSFGSFDRRSLEAMFRAAGIELPASGPVAWAPLLERYGDDALRFQLLFDACEDLRVDWRVQELVPNYLSRLLATGESHRLRPPEALPYYDWALETVAGALAIARGVATTLDPRLAKLLDPAATLVDAFTVANELYRE